MMDSLHEHSARLALTVASDYGFDQAVFVIALRAIHHLPPAEFTPTA